jgi:glutamate synthase (NADPH/NADH) small chain
VTFIPLPLHAETTAQQADPFGERIPPLRSEEALVEAGRCLYCFDAPCTSACPTHIDIPAFIKKIATGNLKGSARVILESNILGASCARVCPVEQLCEGACVRNDVDHPVAIGRLQRHATDYVADRGIKLFQPGQSNGYAVAIVGAGPAGLACAAELARAGCAVTVYEREAQLGGLATYGIIPLREPVAVIQQEVQMIADLGVHFCLGVEIGADITLTELLDAYAAVFLGFGAGKHMQAPLIPGSELPGVFDALDLIAALRTGSLDKLPTARRVAVIGGGNTAMDALTVARRMGAEKVICLYRRSVREMTAYPSEYEFVKSEEVEFMWMTAPLRFLPGPDGRLGGVECIRMRLGEPDASGRSRPEPVPDSTFTVDADLAVYATGQQRESGVFESLDLPHEGGRLLVDAQTCSTSIPRLFAGGDSVSTGADLTVVAAVAQGKRAAQAILQQIGVANG